MTTASVFLSVTNPRAENDIEMLTIIVAADISKMESAEIQSARLVRLKRAKANAPRKHRIAPSPPGSPLWDTRAGTPAVALRFARSMAMLRFDSQALHAALDEQRRARELSWRQVADAIGVSASTAGRKRVTR